jgi:hypothetical protein
MFKNFAVTKGCLNDVHTDKIEGGYSMMYGIFLLPVVERAKFLGNKVKMLEIGLGCTMKYGPGLSAHLWKQLLGKNGDIWFAEFDAVCSKNLMETKKDLGFNILVGSQGDSVTCQSWIIDSGGNFDIIIDDGSHRNNDIKVSFDVLFPALKSGGLYFIEDLGVGRMSQYTDKEDIVLADIIASWTEQLVIDHGPFVTYKNEHAELEREKYPLPSNVNFIFVNGHSVVIAKK